MSFNLENRKFYNFKFNFFMIKIFGCLFTFFLEFPLILIIFPVFSDGL